MVTATTTAAMQQTTNGKYINFSFFSFAFSEFFVFVLCGSAIAFSLEANKIQINEKRKQNPSSNSKNTDENLKVTQ